MLTLNCETLRGELEYRYENNTLWVELNNEIPHISENTSGFYLTLYTLINVLQSDQRLLIKIHLCKHSILL